MSMATQTTRVMSGLARHAWIVFAGVGVLMILLGLWPAIFGPPGIERQYALDFILIHVFWILFAVFGLRRGERWAWYAIALWPLWLIAESWSSGCGSFVCRL
jgi:hypothetical protein